MQLIDLCQYCIEYVVADFLKFEHQPSQSIAMKMAKLDMQTHLADEQNQGDNKSLSSMFEQPAKLNLELVHHDHQIRHLVKPA